MNTLPQSPHHPIKQKWDKPQQMPTNIPRYLPHDDTEALVNQLVIAATPLLTLITCIRHTLNHEDVSSLRTQVVAEIKTFEQKLYAIDYPQRVIIMARYCLCTAIDEAVLSRPFGSNSVWVQGSLLSLFHKETRGGERFYVILEDAIKNVRQNIDFIELLYLILSLGFEGKFYLNEHKAVLAEIRNRLFYRIRNARTKPDRSLSNRLSQDAIKSVTYKNKRHVIKWSLVTIIVISVFAVSFRLRLLHHMRPIVNQLQQISALSPSAHFDNLTHPLSPIYNKTPVGSD